MTDGEAGRHENGAGKDVLTFPFNFLQATHSITSVVVHIQDSLTNTKHNPTAGT